MVTQSYQCWSVVMSVPFSTVSHQVGLLFIMVPSWVFRNMLYVVYMNPSDSKIHKLILLWWQSTESPVSLPGKDPGQNGHTPKRPHPKRPQLFWLPKRPQPKQPHCIGQNGHTGRITTKTATLHLVKTATKGGSLPKRPNCIWSKRPQREDHYQNGHTTFGQNGHKGRITTKTATLHLVKTAAQERPLPKRPHCIWSKRPHREGDHWISCQASVTHAGVLARMQQGPFLGRY